MIADSDKNRDSSESGDAKVTGLLMAEKDEMHKADNAARNDPNLRMEMCRLIDELGTMLNDHAAALAHAEGDAGAFNVDIKKDLLTWQLGEYLIRGYIERDPAEPPIVRGWQVDEPHAFDFFRVNVLSDSSLVALEVEASRKS